MLCEKWRMWALRSHLVGGAPNGHELLQAKPAVVNIMVKRRGLTASCMNKGDCVKKTRERHAVGEMRDDPSESPYRRRLQTAMSCFGQKPRWCCVKKARERHAVREMKDVDPRRGLTASCMNEGDERKQTPVEASKGS